MQSGLAGTINAKIVGFDGIQNQEASIPGFFQRVHLRQIKCGSPDFGHVFRPVGFRRRKEPHVHCPCVDPRKTSAPRMRHAPARLGPAGLPRQSPAKPMARRRYIRPRPTSPCGHARGGRSLGINRGASAFRASRFAADAINAGPRPLRLGGRGFAQPCHPRWSGNRIADGAHIRIDRHASGCPSSIPCYSHARQRQH